MKNKHFSLLACVMIMLVAFASVAAASNWSQFQKNEKHTGITSDNGPDGATISVNGNILVGSGIETVPVTLGNYVYVEGASKLYKYDKSTLNYVADCTVAAGGIQNANPASDGNNIIYVVDTGYGSNQQKITAVYASSMTEKWSTNFAPASQQCSCPITYYNDNGVGKLFVGTVNMSTTDPVNLSDDGTYFAFYADNGTEIWSRATTTGGGYYWAGATVVGNFLVYPDDTGTLTSVYISNGTKVDDKDLSNKQIRSSATYNADDQLIYVAGKDKYVHAVAINPNTGMLGTHTTSSRMAYSSTSTPAYNTADDRIYVGCGSMINGGYLYCLNATTLTTIWDTSGDPAIGNIQSSPAVADDGINNPLIFVTGNDAIGKVYRIKDLGNTYSITSDDPPNATYSLAGVAISDNYAYFGNDNGYLYQVN
ncbi:outer membrane protein assembly factor BamB family protein [Methanosarcina barkeri]|uniref:Cell surface protein n=1 Tax=Methanosarcina barkeri CM1 TaxID=796385 RepID=A0A0G3C784_METBA|nr:PQQ-binding-like beta-propeller repeat protein [Methanosarcina barkeri]AKJ37836.1 cell surface protein [Methanosarcina barkeri CM1]